MATAALALPAELTMGHARAVLAQLAAALRQSADAVIDASGLQSLDTAAIAVLMECSRQAAAQGKALRVTGAPPKLGQLARLYGVDGLLGLQVAPAAAVVHSGSA